MRLRLVVALGVLPLLVGGVVVGGAWWASGRDARTTVAEALDALPADTQSAGVTDWAAVRERVDVGDARTESARGRLNDDAALLDLSTRSVLGRSVERMHDAYGWSAADLAWEAFGQAGDGAVVVARLDDALDPAEVRAGLRRLGYRESGGTWSLPEEVVPEAAGTDLAQTLRHVVVLPRERLVVASDRVTYVATVLDVVRGEQPSLLEVRAAADVAGALSGSDAVLLQTGPNACTATGLAEEDDTVRAQAAAAASRAGGLSDVDFAGRGITDGDPQELRFALAFGSPGEAAAQASVRERLAAGPFIGRSGRVEDSLGLRAVTTRSSVVTLVFEHEAETGSYMIGSGPLLFASCPA